MTSNTRSLPLGLKVFVVFLIIVSTFTTNPLPTITAILFPPIAASLLWKKNEPPILFLGIMLQWLQVTIKLFYANFLSVEFPTLYSYPAEIASAFYLSMLGLTTLSLGIFYSIRKFSSPPLESIIPLIRKLDRKKVIAIYLIVTLLSSFIQRYSFMAGGLQQFLIKLIDFKWSLFFLFYLVAFNGDSRAKKSFFLIVVCEILIGFTGYFSSFKEFFIFGSVCFLTLKSTIKGYTYVLLALGAIILFNFMVVWQFVKPEYRKFLSSGETAQVVTVGTGDALAKLIDLTQTMDKNSYQVGIEALLDRTSYIDIFSSAISYVPDVMPHENGTLWKDAIMRVLMPRFFFPNKSVIDDSQKTIKYTGQSYAGADQGTSISLGYITESYVDFGPYVMLIPLFFFGFTIGLVYKFIMTRSKNHLWAIVLVSPLFFQIDSFESALNKTVGSLIAFFLVFLILRKFGINYLIDFLNARS